MTRNTQTAFGSWGVDLGARDVNVAPSDDFFRYANGRWLESFEIPADKPRYGSFDKLVEDANHHVRAIIEDIATQDLEPGSGEQKLRDLYQSLSQDETRERSGLASLTESFRSIAAITSKTELLAAFATSHTDMTYAAIDWSVGADLQLPDRQILSLGYGSLSLPDRDYYLVDAPHFAAIREKYLAHLEAVFRLLPESGLAPAEAADRVFKLETRLATVHWSRTATRDIDRTYNLRSLAQLCADFPSIDWVHYFNAAGVGEITECNVTTPSAIAGIAEIIENSRLADWSALLAYRLVVNTQLALPGALDQQLFDFYGRVLKGLEEPEPRWQRIVSFVSQSLGDVVGQHYVDRHFPPQAKAKIDRLVANIVAELTARIASAAWMSEATREKALNKLAQCEPRIAYPDQWRDYSDLSVSKDDAFGNLRAVSRFIVAEQIADLAKPTDRSRWFMSPQTVNAYYTPVFNQIVFPAAILQPPFFDPNADDAVNYGSIGVVIGHEIGHGFDDQGRKFNANGQKEDWWTDEDKAAFSRATNKLIDQFGRYERLPDEFVDGELTLGENIADLGGLTLAYAAYRRSLGDMEPPLLDGLTAAQRFFLAYAQIWRIKERDEFALAMLKAAPHSPPEFRVNGALRNIDAWYEAFDIGADSTWYLPPADRARIW